MKQTRELKQVIEREFDRIGFTADYSFQTHSSQPHFKARTYLGTNEVEISYNSDYERSAVRDVTSILRALPNHEAGHHNRESYGRELIGVPGDVETSKTCFFEPMYEVLAEKGFTETDTEYAENALEDSLLHLAGSNSSFWYGITGFFEDVAKSEKNNKFTDFDEAHVKLNMFLWGTPQQKNWMRRYYQNNEKTTKALSNFMKRTNMVDERGIKPRAELESYFLDRDNWPEISRIYAEEFSELMTKGYAMPTFNHSGKGTKGNKEKKDENDGNVFQRQRRTPQYRQEQAWKSYKSGTNFPAWMADTDEKRLKTLDSLYQRLTRELIIKAETRTRPEAMPLFYLEHEEFDRLKHNLRDLKLGISRTGKVQWLKKTNAFEIQIPVKTSEKGFPRAEFVKLDTSSSMLEAPNPLESRGSTEPITWGDNSKYHYAVLGLYGFIKYLTRNGLVSSRNNIELHGFAKHTRTVRGLEQAKHLALSPVFEDDTRLSKKTLEDIFSQRENLIMMITDGVIADWDNVKDVFLNGVQDNYCLWLQIGNLTPQAQEAGQAGAVVVPVKGYQDLPKTVIDLTRNIRFRR